LAQELCMSAAGITVVCVTYNNSAAELTRFVQGYRAAELQAQRFGVATRLLYRDNGDPSGLDQRAGGSALALTDDERSSEARNVGYGPAMHGLWGAAFAAGAQAVVTANPDGAFHPDCLVRLHEMALRKPGHLIEARQFPAEHPKEYDPLSGVTPWASGCCVYVSADLFERVGNVDERFWLYMEDVDYSWRVRAAGRLAIMCPAALYAHDTVNRSLSARSRFEMLKAGRLLGWKWGSPRFMAHCERLLALEFADRALPHLGAAPALTGAQELATDFSHAFAFARMRWVL
jgi:GT2 family glycosyltransferase